MSARWTTPMIASRACHAARGCPKASGSAIVHSSLAVASGSGSVFLPAWISSGPRYAVLRHRFSTSLPPWITAQAHGCRMVSALTAGNGSLACSLAPGPRAVLRAVLTGHHPGHAAHRYPAGGHLTRRSGRAGRAGPRCPAPWPRLAVPGPTAGRINHQPPFYGTGPGSPRRQAARVTALPRTDPSAHGGTAARQAAWYSVLCDEARVAPAIRFTG